MHIRAVKNPGGGLDKPENLFTYFYRANACLFIYQAGFTAFIENSIVVFSLAPARQGAALDVQ
jgi:hypothetical protein